MHQIMATDSNHTGPAPRGLDEEPLWARLAGLTERQQKIVALHAAHVPPWQLRGFQLCVAANMATVYGRNADEVFLCAERVSHRA